jgi:hypothetical protein
VLPRQREGLVAWGSEREGLGRTAGLGLGLELELSRTGIGLGLAEQADAGSPLAADSSAAWCPDEQLRKEQEAALMLSAMRGITEGCC